MPRTRKLDPDDVTSIAAGSAPGGAGEHAVGHAWHLRTGQDSASTAASDPGTLDHSAGGAGRSDEAEAEDASSKLASIAETVESAAGSVAQAVTSTTATLVRGAGGIAAGAARKFDERPGSRGRQLKRAAREPLPVLWDVHPDAHNAQRRDLGLLQVPVEHIRGTAVEGAQRAGDFLPLPQLRGANWEDRWRRINTALNNLVALPPVDLLKTGDEYWVLDGHNRVGAARKLDQVALDSNVVELLLPGTARATPPSVLGSYLADDMRSLRAAGEGRHSRTAGATVDLEDTEAMRRTFDYGHAENDSEAEGS